MKEHLPWVAIFVAVAILTGVAAYKTEEGRQTFPAVAYTHPAGRHARLPRFVPLADGGVLMSWVEPASGPERYRLRFSVLRERKWLEPRDVVEGGNWFVNWSDFPSVVPIDPDFWVAHWLVKRAGGDIYDYDIAMAYSNDAGQTWRRAGSPHRDGIAAEHGFVAIFPHDGKAGVVWLDGRGYLEGEGRFALRYTTLDRKGTFAEEQVVDGNTCTCCWPAAVVSSLGPVVAWRGRTDEEIRDIRLTVQRDGRWSPYMPLGSEGWRIAGCPVNGPALAARGKRVAAVWFTAQGERPRVRAAFSENGGEKFSAPLEIDDAAPLGRLGLAWLDDTAAVVSWMKAAENETRESAIALRTLSPDGRLGHELRAARISAGRDSGVPQLAVINEGVLLAWTGAAPEFGVHVALVEHGCLKKPVSPMQKWVPFIGGRTDERSCNRHS